MTHLTEQELQVILARPHMKMAHSMYPDSFLEANPGPESELQSVIKAFCKQKGWPVLAFPQTRQVITYLPPGWPDITIIMPYTVLFLELKAGKGRLSPDQKLMRNMFRYLAHTIHEVRSFRKFLDIVESVLRRQ